MKFFLIKTKQIFLIGCLLLTSAITELFAQGPAPPGGGTDPGIGSGAVPINGGLTLLAAAGVVYGIFKVLGKRKQLKQIDQS